MKYIAIPQRPRAYDDLEDVQPMAAAHTVYERDDAPENTGLLNADGTPLYRVRDRVKMGYF